MTRCGPRSRTVAALRSSAAASVFFGALLLAAAAAPAPAATVRVAVAANFQPVLDELGPLFTKASGHELLVSAGSSGKLAAQVEQGAPFDVLLSADAERPRQLVERGHAVAASRFTYARGRLVLWTPRRGQQLGAGTLRAGAFAHLAIANPDAAPYGAAAIEVLRRLEAFERLSPKLVRGESIGQAFAFVESGAAELGLVALSQVAGREDGSRWVVPADLHATIEQQAVLLTAAADPDASRAFLRWLAGEQARAIIGRYGYDLP